MPTATTLYLIARNGATGMPDVTSQLIQAQAHAEANPRPTTLKLWRGGVEVEMWDGGRRVARRVGWTDIQSARINPVMAAIDRCAAEF